MKKNTLLIFCLIIVLSLSACINKANNIPVKSPIETTQPTQETQPIVTPTEQLNPTEETIKTSVIEAVTIPNPWKTHDTLESATSLVGFEITLPESINDYPNIIYSTCSNTLLQVAYNKENNNDKESITIRKSAGGADNSGIWDEYPVNLIVDINDFQASIRGDKTNLYLANWYTEGYSYSIYCPEGMPEEKFEVLIETIS